MIKALLRFYFFKFLIFFSIVFLHLWLQSMLERQVLRLFVDPCYTADDRPYDNHQGNRACNSDYDVNHYVVYVVVVVICRTKTKNNNTAKRHNLIFKINKKLSYRRGTARHAVTDSENRAKYRTNVRRIAFDKSCIGRITFKVIQVHWKWHE